MTQLKRVRRLCLAVLCLTSVFALGVAGSASAADTLLFKTENGKATYHLTGLSLTGTSVLETVGGKSVKSSQIHALVLTLTSTLFDTRLLFLDTLLLGLSSAPCSDLQGGRTGDVLLELLGHLGLADPGKAPAVLLLIPEGFSFECTNPLGGEPIKISVRGSVIGLITKPKVLTASEEFGIIFKQEKGKQEHTEFLLPNGVVMSNQLLESAENGGVFEQAGEGTPETVLKALEGEGKFLLIDE